MNLEEFFEINPNVISDMAALPPLSEYNVYSDLANVITQYCILHYGYCQLFFKTPEATTQAIRTVLIGDAYSNQTIYETTKLTYDPIKNYDMIESEATQTGADSSITLGEHTTTVSVSPFNTPAQMVDTQQSTTPRVLNSSNDESSTKRTLERSGNIGVTTSQQMIMAEREVANLNIASDIARKICTQIAILLF